MAGTAAVIPGYEIQDEIGRGGFATVYRARQLAFDREVAVKVIDRPNPDQDTLEQFRRECRAVGSLSWHPHVVSVFDAGETADGRPYLTMELLTGGSLEDALGRGPLPVDQAVAFGLQIADAVAAAHELGVLHRDLKPANVLVDRRGGAQLADFGIVRMMSATTTAGAVSGTIAYMAPELLQGERASPASDVYGIGMVIAAMLLGRAPFDVGGAETPWAMVHQVAQGQVPDLRSVGAPDALARLVEACTARDPAGRPASAAEVHAVLAAMSGLDGAPDGGHTWRTGPPAPPPWAGSPQVGFPPPGGAEPKRRRTRLVGALAAAAVLVLVAAAVAWSIRDRDGDRQEATTGTGSTSTGSTTSTTATDSTGSTPGSGPSDGSATPADDIGLMTPGTLTVCAVVPNEPFAVETGSKASGFDVDLLRAVAAVEDLELEVVDVGRDGVLDGPADGRCDVAASALKITPERAETVDFTEPYLEADVSLLTRSGASTSTLDELLTTPFSSVGVIDGSTGQTFADESADDIEIKVYPSVETALAALTNGNVDGVIHDLPLTSYAAEQDSDVHVIQTFPTGEGYGFAVEKGNGALLERLNAGLEEVRADGTYDDLYEASFGPPIGD
jgi:ABC-type amino acid transport substrate-binding protein